MPFTYGELWGALYDIGGDEPTVPDISAEVIEQLITLKMVERKATGLPVLTDYGRECRTIMERGDDVYIEGLDPPEIRNDCE